MAQAQRPTGAQYRVTSQGTWTTLNDPKQSKIDYEVSQQPDGTLYYRLKGTAEWMDRATFWSQPWVSIKTPLDPNIAHEQRHKDQYAAYLAARDKWLLTQTYDPNNPTFRDNFPEPKITDYDVGEWANYKPGTTPNVTPGPINPAANYSFTPKPAAVPPQGTTGGAAKTVAASVYGGNVTAPQAGMPAKWKPFSWSRSAKDVGSNKRARFSWNPPKPRV
jgi:hypothetical protein